MIAFQTFAVCVREVAKAAEYVDQLPGGMADKKQPREFDTHSLRQGAQHEAEHTKNPAIAREIAMDHLTEDKNYYRKLQRIEKKAEEPVGFVKGMREFAKNPVSEARKGWAATRNDHPLQKKFLHNELQNKKHPQHFVNDIEHAKGSVARLRRGGWLANYAKYQGPSIVNRGVNTVARHLPGNRALSAIGTIAGLHQDLQKQDPLTGRKRGIGERAGGASLGAAAGLAGMRHGFVGGTALGMMGGATGRLLGRQGDRLAEKAQKLLAEKKGRSS